jgi:hypothetical protein
MFYILRTIYMYIIYFTSIMTPMKVSLYSELLYTYSVRREYPFTAATNQICSTVHENVRDVRDGPHAMCGPDGRCTGLGWLVLIQEMQVPSSCRSAGITQHSVSDLPASSRRVALVTQPPHSACFVLVKFTHFAVTDSVVLYYITWFGESTPAV